VTVSPVDIAEKRRVLDLLQKMRAGETLTRGQLREVKAYQKAQGSARSAGTLPPKLSRKVPAPAKQKKKAGKIKRHKQAPRPPISQADVKRLAFVYESIAQADQQAGTPVPLVDVLIAYPKLMAAWGRGELLRRLQACASVLDNVHDVARELGFAKGKDVREWFDGDREAQDIWLQTRFVTRKRAMAAMVQASMDGNQRAIQVVADKLDEGRQVDATPGKDWHTITLKQMEAVTAKSRQTLFRWRTQANMPAMGAIKTMRVDLRKFFPWFEKYITRLMTKGVKASDPTSPLQQRKIRDMDRDYNKSMGELLGRGPTIGWQTAQIQNIINAFAQIPDLVNDIYSQPREKIARRLEDFQVDLLHGMQKIPDMLQLEPEALAKLTEFYEILTRPPAPIEPEAAAKLAESYAEPVE
jgi:hypothetical protein